MRCGTRSMSTWMVAGVIGELSWGLEGLARDCCRSLMVSLQLVRGARIMRTWTPQRLTS